MKIKWVGETRIIPKIGIAAEGNILDVPDEDGTRLVNQGLAKKYKEPKNTDDTGGDK